MKTQRAAAAAPFDVDDEQPPPKRPKIQEQAPSVDDLNDDCLLNILTNLVVEDLNSIAMVNRRFREARRHESLDQTRSGTIVLTDTSTASTLLNAIERGDWGAIFSGNRSRLKIVGIEKLRGGVHLQRMLPGVTSLDARSSSPSAPSLTYDSDCLCVFSVCPNVTELKLGDVNTRMTTIFRTALFTIGKWLPQVTKLTWIGWHDGDNHICGHDFENFKNLTELQLDNCEFTSTASDGQVKVYGDPETDSYLLKFCNRDSLRCISIKNATWRHYGDRQSEAKVFPQEVLIKFVRKFPSLRWFRSDLTAANVAMLKDERPEVTFVSE